MVTMLTTTAKRGGTKMGTVTYKGWELRHEPPPVRARDFDWVAIHPQYDCWMEDGDWESNGMCIHAPNRQELMDAIDEWEAEHD